MIEPNDVHKTLDRHILADGMKTVLDIEKSKGSYLYDAKGKKKYLDMFSMYASSPIGYNHPYVKKKKDFLGKMAINKPSMSDMYNVHYAEFVETFSRVAIPNELPNLFFISGGALAVENALKVAFDWKTRKNLQKGIDVEGDKVIHFQQAFHGRSGYTLSLTNTSDPRKYMFFPTFPWPRIINPKLRFPLSEEKLAETKQKEIEALNQIQQAIEKNPHSIAALIIEPIQSEGGDNHFRDEFMQALRVICDEFDIFLIFDEVQTGMGITGKMWAYQHTSIVPDALAFGKKTQVCGILVSDRVKEVANNCFEESSRINSTFGGNFIDMMRFQLILEVIEKENLVEQAATVGNHLKKKLLDLQNKFGGLVSNARGVGLLCAFDLPGKEVRDQFRSLALENELLILACGDRSIRFRPHLTVSKKEIDKAIQVCEQCLTTLNKASK